MPPDTSAINRGRIPPQGRGGVSLWRARISGFLLVALLPLILHAGGGDEMVIRVIGQHPGNHGVLALGEPLYLRIAYDSSERLRFQARVPTAAGHGAMMNPAPLHAAGNGEALAWLALREPAGLDEVDIQVWDAGGRTRQTLGWPLAVRWTASAPAPQPLPQWVDELNRRQQEMTQAPVTTDSGDSDTIPAVMVGLSLPAYLVLQLRVWRRWQGGWRMAGLLPLWGTVPLLAYTLVAFAAGSNLWPLLLILLSPVVAGYLVLIGIARALLARREEDRRTS